MSMLMAAKSTSLYSSNPTISARIGQNPRAVRSVYPTVRMQSRVHRLIEEQGAVLIPGVYDALSAAIVQQTGFSAALISGYALSAVTLGKPDFGLITYACCFLLISSFSSVVLFVLFCRFRPPEMAATARSVCAAAPTIPIIADAGKSTISILKHSSLAALIDFNHS